MVLFSVLVCKAVQGRSLSWIFIADCLLVEDFAAIGLNHLHNLYFYLFRFAFNFLKQKLDKFSV